MKKVLVIASVLFASATVFGMNQQAIQKKEISGINQSKNMRDLSIKKEACKKLFDLAQSGLKENNRFSEDAKLLYSKLKFEDVWKEIEQIFFSIAPDENNSKNISNNLEISFKQMVRGTKLRDALYKFYSTEEIGKRKAKFFYKQVLGNSELGRDLYEKAVLTIDSADCRQYPDMQSAYNSGGSGALDTNDSIRCDYYTENDLFSTLVHETGHVLDYHYRRIKKLEKVNIQQSEYVSIFFECLSKLPLRIRLWECYLSVVYNDLAYELMISRDISKLDDLFFGKEQDQSKQISVMSELKKDNKIGPYLERLLGCCQIFNTEYGSLSHHIDVIEKGEYQWRNLLQILDDKGLSDLSQMFRDIEKGEIEGLPHYVEYKDEPKLEGSIYDPGSGSFVFIKGSEKIIKSIPKELKKIDWVRIDEIATAWQWFAFGNYRSFLSVAIGMAEQMVKDGSLNLNWHTEGTYNAFRLIKEKGYFEPLEDGKSLPIEEVMEELTKPAKPLNLTEESVEEFFEFLRAGKLAS